MKTLALAEGDLVVSSTGHATVSGTPKITTELTLALAEPFGDDRFHTSWGSYLPSYVGQPIDATTEMLVNAEVNRVLQNYIAIQRAGIINDSLNQSRSRYSTADVIGAVVDVQTQQVLDSIYVKITLRTVSGETATITKAVTL